MATACYTKLEMINQTIQQITNPCSKCGQETGASWKTLCRICWKNQDPEEIRAYRQAKLDRKIARMEKRAGRMNQEADQKMSAFNQFHGDISFFTQPNINSSAGRSFTRFRERVYSKYDAGMKLQSEAEDLKEKAEYLRKTGAVVKGDAERKRQAKREIADQLFKVGDRVYDPIGGNGEIIKVNTKTFRIKFDRGFTWNQDKSWIVKEVK